MTTDVITPLQPQANKLHSELIVDYDHLFETLISIVSYKSKKFKAAFPLTDSVDLRRWLREVKTVGIDLPRQCGKSTWIKKKLKENDDSCVVVVNPSVAKDFLMSLGALAEGRVFTAKDVALTMRSGVGCKWSTVFIDDAAHITDRLASNTLYKWLAMKNDPNLTVVSMS